MALSVEQLRELDSSLEGLSDVDVERLIDWAYVLADAVFDRWLEKRNSPQLDQTLVNKDG